MHMCFLHYQPQNKYNGDPKSFKFEKKLVINICGAAGAGKSYSA